MKPEVLPGTTVIGSAAPRTWTSATRYELLERLATRGTAEIFLARGILARGVERHCVLKRIRQRQAADGTVVRRFLAEARVGARLQHANVVYVYDLGTLGDSWFFTMEYVHGVTVRDILQRARVVGIELPPSSVIAVISGAAAGLHHAHERRGIDGQPLGIVHRDVSTSNLMVSHEGTVKLVGFGIASTVDQEPEARPNMVAGTLGYLAPEQRSGLPIDRRADLFSLGIVMWEMLTGRRLYRSPTGPGTAREILHAPPAPPSSVGRQIPRELDTITLRLLAKRPADRFQTGEELIVALEHAAVNVRSGASRLVLRQLMRDLFGDRPEPWIKNDNDDDNDDDDAIRTAPFWRVADGAGVRRVR